MSRRSIGPLLGPGREKDWEAINRAEQQQHRELALSLTPAERIALGQKLSEQAVALLGAAIEAGHVPKRAYWS